MKFLGYTKALDELTGKDVNGFFLFQAEDVIATREVVIKHSFMSNGTTLVDSLLCIVNQDITKLNGIDTGMKSSISSAMVSHCNVNFKVISPDFARLQIDEKLQLNSVADNCKQPMTPDNNGMIQILVGGDNEGEFKVGDVDIALFKVSQLTKVNLRSIASLTDEDRERLATHYPEHRSAIIPKTLVSAINSEYSF